MKVMTFVLVLKQKRKIKDTQEQIAKTLDVHIGPTKKKNVEYIEIRKVEVLL